MYSDGVASSSIFLLTSFMKLVEELPVGDRHLDMLS
jgi:hypothetical protein